MDSELERAVRDGMLDAEHASRYWSAMILRYVRRERVVKIFLAIVASATVAGWGFWKEIPWIWQSLSILAAVISVVLPIFDVPRQVEAMTEQQVGWQRAQQEYEAIWLSRETISERTAQSRLTTLKAAEAELSKKAATLPNDDEKLGAKIFDDVIRERGLPKPKMRKGSA